MAKTIMKPPVSVPDAPQLQPQFAALLSHVQSGQPVEVFNWQTFENTLVQTPRNDGLDRDSYFNGFTPSWILLMQAGKYYQAEILWAQAEQMSEKWEERQRQLRAERRVHKGTAFYFWSVTCLLAEKFEKGLVLMHKALMEDQWTSGLRRPQTPARAMVKLDHTIQRNFAGQLVMDVAAFLDGQLGAYRTERHASLTLDDARRKLLDVHKYEEDAFWFVYCVFRMHNYHTTKIWGLGDTPFGRTQNARFLSDICLVLENLMANRVSVPANVINPTFHTYMVSWKPHLNGLGVNKALKASFSKTIKQLLKESYVHGTTKLKEHDADIALAYGLRNYASHEIASQKIVQRQFDLLTTRLMFAVFHCIEDRYRRRP